MSIGRSPVTGIDVASARQIRGLIRDLNAGGTTVFLTTHYIEEAERLCHRIAFIVGGRIVKVGTTEELMDQHQKETVLEMATGGLGSDAVEAFRGRFPDLEMHMPDDKRLRVVSPGPIRIAPLLGFLDERGVVVTEAKLIRPSLEDVFVKVTGIESGFMMQEREGRKK